MLTLSSYALSQRGARRSLYQIGGFKSIDAPVDVEYIHHMLDGRLKSYAVSPPPLVHWRTPGPNFSDNEYDIIVEDDKDSDHSQSAGFSEGLLHSARVALETLDKVVYTIKPEPPEAASVSIADDSAVPRK